MGWIASLSCSINCGDASGSLTEPPLNVSKTILAGSTTRCVRSNGGGGPDGGCGSPLTSPASAAPAVEADAVAIGVSVARGSTVAVAVGIERAAAVGCTTGLDSSPPPPHAITARDAKAAADDSHLARSTFRRPENKMLVCIANFSESVPLAAS